jgi:hypothetical protein
MEVLDLIQTCGACPSQWEGITDKGRPVYVRYRYGVLSVEVGDPGATVNQMMSSAEQNEYCILSRQLGDEYDGTIVWDKVHQEIDAIDPELVIERLKKLYQVVEPDLATTAKCKAEKHFFGCNCVGIWSLWRCFNEDTLSAVLSSPDETAFSTLLQYLKTVLDKKQSFDDRQNALNYLFPFFADGVNGGEILIWSILKDDTWLINRYLSRLVEGDCYLIGLTHVLRVAVLHEKCEAASQLCKFNQLWKYVPNEVQQKLIMLLKRDARLVEQISSHLIACELNGESSTLISSKDLSWFSL